MSLFTNQWDALFNMQLSEQQELVISTIISISLLIVFFTKIFGFF